MRNIRNTNSDGSLYPHESFYRQLLEYINRNTPDFSRVFRKSCRTKNASLAFGHGGVFVSPFGLHYLGRQSSFHSNVGIQCCHHVQENNARIVSSSRTSSPHLLKNLYNASIRASGELTRQIITGGPSPAGHSSIAHTATI